MEGEPPPVTIVDPRLGTGDEPEGGRDPWRPTRRQGQVLAAALAVALVAAGAVALTERSRHAAATRRAEVRALSLHMGIELIPATVPNDVDPRDVPVRNDGADTVTVLRARLGPDNDWTPLGTDVPSTGYTHVVLPDSRPCDATVVDHPITAIELEVRTRHGARSRVQVPLLGPVPTRLNHVTQVRCGLLPTDQALSATGLEDRVGRTAVFDLEVGNASVEPLTLLALSGPPGTTVSGFAVPLTLDPLASPAAEPTPRRLHLEVRVTACAAFLRAYGDPVGLRLTATARGPHGTADVLVRSPYGDGPLGSVFYEIAPAVCPDPALS